MAAKIVVVGSFNTDLTAYVQRMPRPGETVAGDRFVTGPGGKGSNQAVAAARLGAEVTFVGRIGDDVFAPVGLDLWRAEGINTDHVVQDPDVATGVAPIVVDSTGENSICVILGANLRISLDDIDAAAEAIASADVLLTQLETNHDAVVRALQLARSSGVRTILNPAPASVLPPGMLALADYLTPNETELEVISGLQGGSLDDAIAAVRIDDQQVVVVTLGSKGARFVQRADEGFVGGFEVDVVDTTGAGDAFNAGLAVALAEGNALPGLDSLRQRRGGAQRHQAGDRSVDAEAPRGRVVAGDCVAAAMADSRNILVVCYGNLCRSPMAEGLLRDRLPLEYEVRSAGTHAYGGDPPTGTAREVMQREAGISARVGSTWRSSSGPATFSRCRRSRLSSLRRSILAPAIGRVCSGRSPRTRAAVE